MTSDIKIALFQAYLLFIYMYNISFMSTGDIIMRISKHIKIFLLTQFGKMA